ncbi:MAG: hypothetical protein HYW48_11765 [Deltaproteobacteria bacterium]|nr:hypothetical protein [Deltaproteobacteria bacterium]
MNKPVYDCVPDFLKEAVCKTMNSYRGDLIPAAFLDFDGTLIHGDITDGLREGPETYKGLLELAILAGLLPSYKGPEGVSQMLKDLLLEAQERNVPYIYAAKPVANLSSKDEAALQALVVHELGQMVERYLFSFTHDLFSFFKKEGIEPYVVSASPHVFVSELYQFTPIPKENLFGVNLNVKNGKRVDGIDNHAEGKAERVYDMCMSRNLYPVLSLGNRWSSDGHMLQHVLDHEGIAALVNEPDNGHIAHDRLFHFQIS